MKRNMMMSTDPCRPLVNSFYVAGSSFCTPWNIRKPMFQGVQKDSAEFLVRATLQPGVNQTTAVIFREMEQTIKVELLNGGD